MFSVLNTPEEFENGSLTLKTHQMFSVYTTPEEFKNVASLTPTVRPAIHTNASRKRNFFKTLFTPEELQDAGFAFNVDAETFQLALYGTTGGTCSARFFRPVMLCPRSFASWANICFKNAPDFRGATINR